MKSKRQEKRRKREKRGKRTSYATLERIYMPSSLSGKDSVLFRRVNLNAHSIAGEPSSDIDHLRSTSPTITAIDDDAGVEGHPTTDEEMSSNTETDDEILPPEENQEEPTTATVEEQRHERPMWQRIGFCILFINIIGTPLIILGFHKALINSLLPDISLTFPVVEDDVMLEFAFEHISSVSNVLGGIFGGVLADFLGRMRAIVLGNFIFGAAFFINCDGKTPRSVIGAIGVQSLGIGISCSAAKVYLIEIAPQRCRGAIATCFKMLPLLGEITSYFLYPLFSMYKDNWRTTLATFSLIGFMHCLPFTKIPESPRWSMKYGEKEEAVKTFYLFLSAPEAEAVIKYFDNPKEKGSILSAVGACLEDEAVKGSLKNAALLQVLHHCIGLSILISFGRIFVKLSGIAVKDSIAFAFMGAVRLVLQLIGYTIAMSTVDCHGRKKVIYRSLTGIACGLVLFLPYAIPDAFHLLNDKGSLHYKIAAGGALLGVNLLSLSSFSGIATVPDIMASESFPVQCRGICMAIVSAVSWASSRVLPYIFTWLMLKIRSLIVALIWSLFFSIAFGLFVCFRLQDFSQRPLEIGV